MTCLRLFLVALLVACTGGATASAGEWPLERQFPLVEPPPPVHAYPPPSSVVEDTDGSLLVLVYWPSLQPTRFGETEWPHTSLVRIAPDGSRAFVPPFGAPEPKFPTDAVGQVDDEILPLRDGSILITRSNEIDRLRPNGSIKRFAPTLGAAHGLTRFPDGSIVFANSHRIQRVGRNGKMTTIAGTGEIGDGGDGGPATEAKLARPRDVLPEDDGGFLIADTGNNRVRRVSPDGTISTIAGTGAPDPFGNADPFEGTGDGGPATAAGIAVPAHLARLPDGSLLIGEWRNIRRVAPDGTISTIFHADQVYGDRLGDYAGRFGDTIEAMDTTREGGIALITAGYRLRALYLAPRHTRRTLVALRGTSVSGRRVQATVDATTGGVLQLTVRRGGKLIARSSRRVRAGRSTIGVNGRFAAADHKVKVRLHADRGGAYGDHIHVFTSDSLPKRLVTTDPNTRCERIGRRRIDCEAHYEEDEEDGIPCLYTVAHRLFRSGLTFARAYGPGCHHEPIAFERTPDWTGPWRAAPPH
jgi:hypothetical protein